MSASTKAPVDPGTTAHRVHHPRRRAIVRYVSQSLVVALLAISATAWVVLEKSVTVTIDGQARVVRTYAGTVGSALSRANIVVGEHDALSPAPSEPIKDGSHVTLRRGRLVTLSLDGHTKKIWVTGTNVDEVLAQVGVRTRGVYVSASRSRAIGLAGFSFAVRMPHRVEIVADGQARRVVTTAATVKDLLAANRVRLAKTDKVSVPLKRYPTEGLVIRVTRIRAGVVSESSPIAHAVDRRPDPTMYQGNERYTDYGLDGVLVQMFKVTYTNGVLSSKTLTSSKVTSKPRTAVLYYGTKPLPWRESCSASWYGLNGYGAAHRTLPFGTRVRVVNVATGASVVVTINDRGPFVEGRCIDLDQDAFAQIAPLGQGTANVRLYY